MSEQLHGVLPANGAVRLFLCGDVMTGRGIDQVLAHPCRPSLYERYVQSALDYVRLAERANGPIPRPVPPSYVWGDALTELNRRRPHVRIINLETSVTRCEQAAPKGINYRMSIENPDCLTAAGIDCCVLANNHVLDWGTAGLIDTLATLEHLQIKTAGAGRHLDQARAPAILNTAQARVLVFSFATVTSGTPRSWTATGQQPGVNVIDDVSEATACRIADEILRVKRPGDVVVVSIHWGPNWGYEISREQQSFAHSLIDRAGIAVVHGHSSHHPKAVEVYANRLIFYGCGDFLNDYEGISGYEEFRSDLALMYFVDVNPVDGSLATAEIVPLQIHKLRLRRASKLDVEWVRRTLDRESRQFATQIVPAGDGVLAVSAHGPISIVKAVL